MVLRKRLAKGLSVVLLVLSLSTVLVMPGNTGAAELSDSRKVAITMIDRSLQTLAENAEEYQTYIDMAEDYLPADSANMLNEMLFVAQLDLTPPGKT